MIDESTNFYTVLGITDEEKKLTGDDFRAILKKKHRQLVRKYHPDKHTNEPDEKKKEAEEIFKCVQRAYTVLSDDMERMKYDFSPSMYSGSSAQRTVRRPQEQIFKGRPKKLRVMLTLEDLYKGGKKTVTYKVQRHCKHCEGKGGENVTICPQCGGSGTYVEERSLGFGYSRIEIVCPACHGIGRIINNPCKHCQGSGLEVNDESITLDIPDADALIREYYHPKVIPCVGNDIPAGLNGQRGDLYIEYSFANPDDSEWTLNPINPYDIKRKIEVPMLYCVLGKKINIKHIDGSEIAVSLKEGTQNNAILRIRGKGLPFDNGRHRGDLYILIDVKLPEQLNDEERKLLRQLENSDNFKRKK